MIYKSNTIKTLTAIRYSLLLMTALCFSITATAAELRVVSGNGEAGFVDGTDARFNKPIRLAPFGPGRILVADINNHAVRVVGIDGMVKTLAGGPDKQGHQDGPADIARFNSPHGVALSNDGSIIVAGASSHTVRLLSRDADSSYQVSTLAGMAGQSGYRDGPASQALFNSPHAVVAEADGGVLIVDIGNACIRRVKDGVVTTVAKADTENIGMPIDLMAAGDGSYLIADAGSQKALRWVPGEVARTISPETELAMPHGVAGDSDGNTYVAEIRGHQVTRLADGKESVRVAGTGVSGLNQDQLNKPAAVLVHDGFLWIADLNNHRISILPLK